MKKINQLIEKARDKFDLTDPDYQQSLYDLSNELIDIKNTSDTELMKMAGDKELPLEFRDDKDLGNPEVMSPEEVRGWIRGMRSEVVKE